MWYLIVFLSFVPVQIEGSIMHIMKALANHPSAAPSLIEDDSLQLLFHMVANGSLIVIAQFRDGLVPLHTIQLHRHAMQVCYLYMHQITCSIDSAIVSGQFLIYIFISTFYADSWPSSCEWQWKHRKIYTQTSFGMFLLPLLIPNLYYCY